MVYTYNIDSHTYTHTLNKPTKICLGTNLDIYIYAHRKLTVNTCTHPHVHTYIHMCLPPTPHVKFNRFEFRVFLSADCYTKAEESGLSYYLPIVGGRIVGFIPFPKLFALCEWQIPFSGIWTRVTESVSNDNNNYTTCIRVLTSTHVCTHMVSSWYMPHQRYIVSYKVKLIMKISIFRLERKK